MKPERIQTRLRNTPAWAPEQKPRAIVRTMDFGTFSAAAEFLRRVGEIGSMQDHYPEVTLKKQTVTLRLSTPEAGGLSELDFDVAERIDDAAQ